MLALATISLAAGLFFLPRPDERVAMLQRDGQVENALQQLQAMRAAGDHRPRILRQIAELSASIGNIENAIGALEGYLAVRPRDWTARDQLASFYLAAQRADDYVGVAEVNMALRPSADRLHALLGFYRLHGRFNAEERLLVRYLDSPYLRPRDLERAGALLASRFELDAAARALILADERAPPQEESGRLLLFDVLLRDGREREAKDRALRWIAAWRKTSLAISLIERLARLGNDQLVLDIVRESHGDLPDIESAAVWFLVDRNLTPLARQVLETWSEQLGGAEQAEIRRFVAASLAAGGAAGPLRLLRHLAVEGIAPQTQAIIAEEVAAAYGFSALGSVGPLLSYQALAMRPVFGAELAMQDGSPSLARILLENADLRALAIEQRAHFFVLLRQVEPDIEVFKRLSRLWRLHQLPDDMLPPLAQLALSLGSARDHDAIWSSMGRRYD
jgi:hypothetical protein